MSINVGLRQNVERVPGVKGVPWGENGYEESEPEKNLNLSLQRKPQLALESSHEHICKSSSNTGISSQNCINSVSETIVYILNVYRRPPDSLP